MTHRFKLFIFCVILIAVLEAVSILFLDRNGIGAQNCMILSFIVAWATEKEADNG